MILIGTFIYFGALLIPAVYLLVTRWQGAAKRAMLIGVGLQVFYTLAVAAFVYVAWRSGHADYYYGWTFLLPVNFVGLIYFLAVLFIYARKSKE
ncbi:MAG: hypothetical protein WDM80_10840 [Limisphaerales bacterium]